MNLRGLTYYFLIIFLVSAGAVVSGPVSAAKNNSKAGSVYLGAGKSIAINSPTTLRSNIENRLIGLTGYRQAPIDKPKSDLYINYLHSEAEFDYNNNSGRTSIWFTSRIKN